MPEYDAFGREIGDDPLAGLRDAVNPAPPPKPAVEAAPEPVVAAPEPAPVAAAPPTPPRPTFVRPRRRRGGLAGLLVLVAIVAAVGLIGNAAVEKGNDILEQITPEATGPPPTGLQGDSLVREDNFTPALSTLSGARLGKPIMIRVAPDRIDATLVKGGTLHQVQITPDGSLRELGSGDAPATRGTVAWASIDAGAPERLTRAGATRKQPARSIDYVLLTPGPPQTWGAYYKRGRIVIGDRAGKPAARDLTYLPASASSHSASIVKPTITPSIQNCERTASRGSR